MVNLPHQAVGVRGEDSAGADLLSVLTPALPQPGEGEVRSVLYADVVGLLAVNRLLPLIKSISKNQATRFLEGPLEGGLLGSGLAESVNHA